MSAASGWPWPDIRWQEPQANLIPCPPVTARGAGGCSSGNQSGGLALPPILAASYSLLLPGALMMPSTFTAVGCTLSGMLKAQSGSPAGTLSSACCALTSRAMSEASAHTRTPVRTDMRRIRFTVPLPFALVCPGKRNDVHDKRQGPPRLPILRSAAGLLRARPARCVRCRCITALSQLRVRCGKSMHAQRHPAGRLIVSSEVGARQLQRCIVIRGIERDGRQRGRAHVEFPRLDRAEHIDAPAVHAHAERAPDRRGSGVGVLAHKTHTDALAAAAGDDQEALDIPELVVLGAGKEPLDQCKCRIVDQLPPGFAEGAAIDAKAHDLAAADEPLRFEWNGGRRLEQGVVDAHLAPVILNALVEHVLHLAYEVAARWRHRRIEPDIVNPELHHWGHMSGGAASQRQHTRRVAHGAERV